MKISELTSELVTALKSDGDLLVGFYDKETEFSELIRKAYVDVDIVYLEAINGG